MDSSFASQPLLNLALLAALSLVPFAFLTCTSFAKMSVVFSILRNALGTGQAPSGTVLAALSALLSIYVMAPVGERMMAIAAPRLASVDFAEPLDGDDVDVLLDTATASAVPLAEFLERHAGRRERILFFDLARRARRADQRAGVGEHDALVVLPAFIVTELSEALMIGFIIFVPFLVVDMVVANLLLALGMHMLSPTTVSLPFKLLLFVSVDGFYLLSRALVLGYV
jgi:type III secretion protein R